MESVQEFFAVVRERFPAIVARADGIHVDRLNDEEFKLLFLWFENLAEALNEDMRTGVPYRIHAALFSFLAQSYTNGAGKIREYIDVAIVENLFWKVASDKAQPWWQEMPAVLKQLYVGFHSRPPC
jgi:hypothetical protein